VSGRLEGGGGKYCADCPTVENEKGGRKLDVREKGLSEDKEEGRVLPDVM